LYRRFLYSVPEVVPPVVPEVVPPIPVSVPEVGTASASTEVGIASSMLPEPLLVPPEVAPPELDPVWAEAVDLRQWLLQKH